MKNSKILAIVLLSLLICSIATMALKIPALTKADYATIQLVQGPKRAVSNTNSISITMDSAPSQGNLLIATIGLDGYTAVNVAVTSISETNVVWSRAIQTTSTYVNCEVWYGVSSSGASVSITITLSDNANSGSIANVCEWYGLNTTSIVDQTATDAFANPNSAPKTGTTATTTQTTELCVGTVVSSASQSSPTNSFTMLDGTVIQGATYSSYLYRIVSSTGTYGSAITMAGGNWAAGCIATFKAATAEPDTTPPTFGIIFANATVAGNITTFTCAISDNVGVSFHSLAENNSGHYTNHTWTAGAAVSVSITTNNTVGVTIAVQIQSNDTSNNLGISAITYFTVYGDFLCHDAYLRTTTGAINTYYWNSTDSGFLFQWSSGSGANWFNYAPTSMIKAHSNFGVDLAPQSGRDNVHPLYWEYTSYDYMSTQSSGGALTTTVLVNGSDFSLVRIDWNSSSILHVSLWLGYWANEPYVWTYYLYQPLLNQTVYNTQLADGFNGYFMDMYYSNYTGSATHFNANASNNYAHFRTASIFAAMDNGVNKYPFYALYNDSIDVTIGFIALSATPNIRKDLTMWGLTTAYGVQTEMQLDIGECETPTNMWKNGDELGIERLLFVKSGSPSSTDNIEDYCSSLYANTAFVNGTANNEMYSAVHQRYDATAPDAFYARRYVRGYTPFVANSLYCIPTLFYIPYMANYESYPNVGDLAGTNSWAPFIAQWYNGAVRLDDYGIAEVANATRQSGSQMTGEIGWTISGATSYLRTDAFLTSDKLIYYGNTTASNTVFQLINRQASAVQLSSSLYDFRWNDPCYGWSGILVQVNAGTGALVTGGVNITLSGGAFNFTVYGHQGNATSMTSFFTVQTVNYKDLNESSYYGSGGYDFTNVTMQNLVKNLFAGSPDVYIRTLTVTNPQATIYNTPTVPVQLSSSGNDTNPVITYNAKFTNGSWLYGSNQTYTTTTSMTINENATNVLFCAKVVGDHGASDYKEVTFTVNLLPIAITITNPTATTYSDGVNNIPISVSANGGTGIVITWNIKFSNGTWLYGSNQTYTTPTTATIHELANFTAVKFCVHAINNEAYTDYKEVQFNVQYLLSYTLTVSWTTPTNTTHTSSTVSFSVSKSGNETGVTYQIQLRNGSVPVGANQTSATGSWTGLVNGTHYMACVSAIGDHSATDYKTVMFTVEIPSVVIHVVSTIYVSLPVDADPDSIDWGSLAGGDVVQAKVNFSNTNSHGVTNINFTTSNWSPGSTGYFSFESDLSNFDIAAQQSTNVTFTLTVFENVTGISEFSFDINVSFEAELIYTINIVRTAPLNATYNSPNIAYAITLTGNATNTHITGNFYFPNGTALGSNFTALTGTLFIPENVTSGVFAVSAAGDNGASAYDSVVLSVSLPGGILGLPYFAITVIFTSIGLAGAWIYRRITKTKPKVIE